MLLHSQHIILIPSLLIFALSPKQSSYTLQSKFRQVLKQACSISHSNKFHQSFKQYCYTNRSCVNTMTCGGSHLGFLIGIKNPNFLEDLQMIIPGK
jgi:hypothetical protein